MAKKTEEKLRKLIEEDFRRTYSQDFNLTPGLKHLFEKQQVEEEQKCCKDFSFMKLLPKFLIGFATLVLVIFVTVVITNKVNDNNKLHIDDKWELTEEEVSFINNYTPFFNSLPIFEIPINKQISIIIYQGTLSNESKIYFYKLNCDIDEIFNITINTNLYEVILTNEDYFGILCSFENNDSENLELTVQYKEKIMHFAYKN